MMDTGTMNADLNSPVFTVTLPICMTLIVAIMAQTWQNKSAIEGVNKRIDDLGQRLDTVAGQLNKRVDDLAASVRSGFDAVNKRIDHLETRIDAISPFDRR
jgi:tetrahydromethanopterin S-methyltransferase subunit G